MPRILITGTSSGIGLEIAKLLLGKGFLVIGMSRSTSAELKENPSYSHLSVDLSQPNSLEKNRKKIVEHVGDIDAIICNAGVGRFKNLEEFSMLQMQNIMNVNFISQAYLVRLFLPHLKRQKKGDIVFIGSEAALQGKKKGTLYCASKFAIRGFAQALKDEVSFSNIRVSLIQPGMTNTAFFSNHAFEPANDFHSSLSAKNIAELTYMILMSSANVLFEEIVLSPLQKKVQWKSTLPTA